MGDIVGSRIAQRIEDLGSNQSAVAKLSGLTQPSIARLISGETRQTGKLLPLARALQTTPEYLTGESDDPDPKGLADRKLPFKSAPPERPNTVELHEIDLAYGMGGTYLDDVPVTTATMQFSLDWLRRFTRAAPEDLFFAHGIGDSMEPTINDRDIVLIDRSQDRPRMGDQIWAIAFGGVGMIKRLRPRPDGSIAILSDNPSVPEDRAVDDEMHVIGRVVAVVRKI